MSASERMVQAFAVAAFSCVGQKLPKLIAAASLACAAALPASCTAAFAAPIEAEGGRPPFTARLSHMASARQHFENFAEIGFAARLPLLIAPAGAGSSGNARSQGRELRLVGRGTGHGRGLERAGNAYGPGAGALASKRRGAGV
jgi:hypothetical protein